MLTLLQERVWDFVIRVFNFKITLKIRSIRNEKFEIRIICNDQTPNSTHNLEIFSLITEIYSYLSDQRH